MDQCMYSLQKLIGLFDNTFFADFNTRLVRGGDEPLYLPADPACTFHRVIFARGYFSSALHEIAHWCIAGEQRRLQLDYGYWYCADGRSAEQQSNFESVEIKPQAIEMAFHQACGKPFHVSCDNLGGAFEPDHQGFRDKVSEQLDSYREHGFPPRAARFIAALERAYKTELVCAH